MGTTSVLLSDRGNAGWREYFLSELDKLELLREGSDSFSPRRPNSEVLNFARQIADSLKYDDLLLPLDRGRFGRQRSDKMAKGFPRAFLFYLI